MTEKIFKLTEMCSKNNIYMCRKLFSEVQTVKLEQDKMKLN